MNYRNGVNWKVAWWLLEVSFSRLLEGTSSEIIVRERVLGLTERVASGKECALKFVFSFFQFNKPILHPPGNMAPLMLDSAPSI